LLDNNTYVHGLGKVATYIAFDASGKLRYYSVTGYDADDFIEIPNYETATISFDASSTGKTWTFKNGLLDNIKDTPSFSYRAGLITGKNGYTMVFDSNGYPIRINLNGVEQSYPAGDNWINVYNLRVFWRGFGDLTNYDSTGVTPQIGITNVFFDNFNQKIDLARSTTSGHNWIAGKSNLLMRVVGAGNLVYWFYNGRLTDLTDAEVGI